MLVWIKETDKANRTIQQYKYMHTQMYNKNTLKAMYTVAIHIISC